MLFGLNFALGLEGLRANVIHFMLIPLHEITNHIHSQNGKKIAIFCFNFCSSPSLVLCLFIISTNEWNEEGIKQIVMSYRDVVKKTIQSII